MAPLEKEVADMKGFCVESGYDGGKVDESIVQHCIDFLELKASFSLS